MVLSCDLLHKFKLALEDANNTYLNERMASAVFSLAQNEASGQIVDIIEKQKTDGGDGKYRVPFLQNNTIRRLEMHKYVGEMNNNDDGNSFNNSSHFEGVVEKEMVKVMNRSITRSKCL